MNRMIDSAGIDLPYMANGFEPSKIQRIAVDFDGVISSASRLFYEGISRTVEHYHRAILGLEGPAGIRLVNDGEISALKGTGLFNNDWDLTRILIAYYLALAFRELEGGSGGGGPLDAPEGLGDRLRSKGAGLKALIEAKRKFPLEALASKLKGAGLGGMDALDAVVGFVIPGQRWEALRAIRSLVGFDGEGEDLVKDLFEAIYLGDDLYRRFYGREPPFAFREGLMALERPLPTEDSLRRLSAKFGRLGVYSERSRAQAEYLLGRWGLSDAFDLRSSFFVEDIAGCAPSANSPGPAMGKPNPEPFLRFLAPFAGGLGAIYVGDSLSDLYLVRNANALGCRGVCFAGALSDCLDPGAMAIAFRSEGASAIIWDLNQLPKVLGA